MTMDAIQIIVAALVAGAAAGIGDTAGQAVKDAYGAIKQWLKEKYPDVRVARIEVNPSDMSRQEGLRQDLEDAGAKADAALFEHAKVLLLAIDKDAAARTLVERNVTINLSDVTAAAVRLNRLTAADSVNVEIHKTSSAGDIEISELHSGVTDSTRSNP